MQVVVKNGNVERAMRTLKKKLQKEGVLKELKSRQYYEKPSAKRARKKAEGEKRYRRAMRTRYIKLTGISRNVSHDGSYHDLSNNLGPAPISHYNPCSETPLSPAANAMPHNGHLLLTTGDAYLALQFCRPAKPVFDLPLLLCLSGAQ